MTRERIEDFREIVLPFLSRTLLKTNYENMGKPDAEEFEKDFNEILDLAIKALEQEPINDTTSKLLDETFDDFCECPGGEGWFYIDGEKYNTDAGYALEGMEIFIKVLKKRLSKSEDKK